MEWPEGEPEPTRFWLSNLPASLALKALIVMAKLRWRIERDYQELKTALGLDHFEGRTWCGFHHHAALCIATYAFLMAERARLSPPTLRTVARLAELAFSRSPPSKRGFGTMWPYAQALAPSRSTRHSISLGRWNTGLEIGTHAFAPGSRVSD